MSWGFDPSRITGALKGQKKVSLHLPVVPFQGDRFLLRILVSRALPGAELFRPPRGKKQQPPTSKLAPRLVNSEVAVLPRRFRS